MANAEFKNLSVDDIILDYENPRIALWIEMYKKPSSEDIPLNFPKHIWTHLLLIFYLMKHKCKKRSGILRRSISISF